MGAKSVPEVPPGCKQEDVPGRMKREHIASGGRQNRIESAAEPSLDHASLNNLGVASVKVL